VARRGRWGCRALSASKDLSVVLVRKVPLALLACKDLTDLPVSTDPAELPAGMELLALEERGAIKALLDPAEEPASSALAVALDSPDQLAIWDLVDTKVVAERRVLGARWGRPLWRLVL